VSSLGGDRRSLRGARPARRPQRAHDPRRDRGWPPSRYARRPADAPSRRRPLRPPRRRGRDARGGGAAPRRGARRARAGSRHAGRDAGRPARRAGRMSRADRGFLVAAVIVATAALVIGIGSTDLWPPDETRVAEIARELPGADGWLVPEL